MAADHAFGCTCGKLRGTLHDVSPKSGSQLQCHCDDCRRAVIWLGQNDPGPDGVSYYQTAPKNVSIDQGIANLKAFAWKNPRLLRWYADCCKTPLFNTLDSPKWAFVSLMTDRFVDPNTFGPSQAHAFVQKPNGKRGHVKALGFMWGFAKRVSLARLSGTWRQTPFFDHSGRPIAPIQTLTQEDRATARL